MFQKSLTISNQLKTATLVFFLLFVAIFRLQTTSSFLCHYYFLSQSLAQGKLDVTEQINNCFNPPPGKIISNDFAIFKGQYFIYLGILPAIIGLPLIFFNQAIYEIALVTFFLGLSIISLSKIINHFLKNKQLIIPLAIFIASPALTNLAFVGPWYLAGLITFSLGLLFLWLYQIKNKNWAIVLIGAMFLTIPTTIFYALIPLADIFLKPKEKNQKFIFLILTLVIALLIFGSYNYFRFGYPLETGYKYATVPPERFMDFRKNEKSITIFLSNAFYYLINPPRVHMNQALRATFPFFELHRYGVGLLFSMPWFLLYFIFQRQKRKDWVYLTSTFLIAITIFYFSGGGSRQIGPRHATDFLPILIYIYFKELSKNKRYLPLANKIFNFSLFLNIYFYFLAITGFLKMYPELP